jgi:hypothetical protein
VHQNTETITLQKSFNNQKLQKSNHLQILNNDLMVLHSAQKKKNDWTDASTTNAGNYQL